MKGETADINLLTQFTGTDLTLTLSRIESAVRGVTLDECASFLESARVGREALAYANAKTLTARWVSYRPLINRRVMSRLP